MASSKATTRNRARRVPTRPYALPALLAGAAPERVDTYCESAMCSAWAVGKDAPPPSRTKAARTRLAGWRLTPAQLAAIAVAMFDRIREYCSSPASPERDKPCEWLVAGSGCATRGGTGHDAHMAAWAVLYAAVSILTEVTIERPEDETALLNLLSYVGWRVPRHQRARVALRMARHVARLIESDGIVPSRGFAMQGGRA